MPMTAGAFALTTFRMTFRLAGVGQAVGDDDVEIDLDLVLHADDAARDK